ncbi:MAG: class I SAM-dependent rRNA methyltransferase [Polyangiaceae bacterium]|nr:class I SAM-dependent rRNA methyltransferase [Polyangiaceae bacterium]
MLSFQISERAEKKVRQGHPWVYRDALMRPPPAATGEFVEVFYRETSLGHALYDAASPLALRMFGSNANFTEVLRARIERAFALRARWFDESTTAHRWIAGEGDRVPGFVVDRYGEAAVLKCDGDAAIARRAEFVKELTPFLAAANVKTLLGRVTGGEQTEILWGEPVEDRQIVREHGVQFFVDLLTGQKTGAFLDQRENRHWVRSVSKGKRVLNLFSYAGGFSLSAAVGGALATTSVDIAAKAHQTAQESFKLHSIVLRGAHEFVTSDVFTFLEQAIRGGKKWDIVISDPPNFAPNEKSKPKAMAAYRKLHALASKVVSPSGLFCAASCSSHVTQSEFIETLRDDVASEERSIVRIEGQPADHPVLAGFPEGRYLKFVVMA